MFSGEKRGKADRMSIFGPSLSFIAPSQCNDQHGRGNGDAFCAFDFGANTSGLTFGTQVGLNPGLILQGDVTIERLVNSIKASRVWHEGRCGMRMTTVASALRQPGCFRRRTRTRLCSRSKRIATATAECKAATTTTASRCCVHLNLDLDFRA